MKDTLVKLTKVGFRAEQTQILSDIDLSVKKNSVVTIIGPNGAGKSTLLKVILGLVKPTTGKVFVQEGTSIGYMPQKLHFDVTMPMTVDYFLNITTQEKKMTVDELLRYLGAEKLKYRSMHDLSGGELQKILLARALMSLPQLLVLDEPVQGVDIAGQKALYELLSQLQKRLQCAMIIVSHDMHMVFSASTQVVCLNKHVCCQGLPEVVAHDPEYVNLFGLQVFAPYVHEHSHHDECIHEGDDTHV